MKLKRRTVLLSRVAGIIGMVVAFWLFVRGDAPTYALVVVVTGIVALVAPDALDALPWGPDKPSG